MNVNIPPLEEELIAEDKNKISHDWATFHTILAQQINTNLGDQGYFYPAITTATAADIAPNFTQSIVYNSDAQKMVLNNDGNYEAIATVALATTSEISQLIQQDGNIGRLYINIDTGNIQFSIDGITIKTIVSI